MGDINEEGLSSETLLEMLRRLPPSKELLDFYHQKVQAFARSVSTPRSDYKGLAYKGFFKPSTEALCSDDVIVTT